MTPAYAQLFGNDMIMSLLPFILIFVIMYFLILRPQQRRVKQHGEMVNALRRGDTVVTSGLGGNYPKALLIGRVSKVEGGPSDLFKRIQVEPAVRPGTLENVLIMTSFIPSRAGPGQ